MRNCAEKSNPPVVKNPLIRTAIRYKAQMNAGYTIRPEDTPAQVMDVIMMIEDKIAEYEKEEQKKIERKMRSNNGGVGNRGI